MAAADKQTSLAYVIIFLLFLNAMFTGGLFFMAQAKCGGMQCATDKKGSGYICPFTKKSDDASGSMKGSTHNH